MKQKLSLLIYFLLGVYIAHSQNYNLYTDSFDPSYLGRIKNDAVSSTELDDLWSIELTSKSKIIKLIQGGPRMLEDLNPPELSIYYDSLCPFSLTLLSGAFKTLYYHPNRDLLTSNIQLYVFGKSKEDYFSKQYDRKFTCNHGSTECTINMLENCALFLLEKKEAFEFIICLSSEIKSSSRNKNRFEESTAKCLPYKYQEIIECTYNGLGHELLHEEGLKEQEIKIEFTPWIVLNGKSDSEISRKISKDIVGYLCNYLKLENKVEGCETKTNTKNKP